MSQPESSGRSVSLPPHLLSLCSPSYRVILTQRFRYFDAYGRPCARPEPEPDEAPPPPTPMEVVRRVLARLFGRK